ncbi:SseB family protein [Streptomyces sp. AV19]|uniref:SAV_915 family protein n=1 Tax=Streptomyces sp. AV19 TaxID=2793068 RepID=UPI0018FE8C37|nr:SAV_915 family protein [Streptomyces sp. AV19]MBH1933314.1 SseB family protein [Streptomyces sp. AV19]MDG4531924.1 SseB family protein [Streptomyces sp. AV19]
MTSPTLDDDLIVLAPARPRPADGWQRTEDGVEFETWHTVRGTVCSLAFTSSERLTACLGPDQPWVALPVGALRHLLGEAGVSDIVVDPPAVPSRGEREDHREEGEAARG